MSISLLLLLLCSDTLQFPLVSSASLLCHLVVP